MTTLTSNKLFVYGTLKEGFPLNHCMDGAKYLGPAITKKAKFALDTANEMYPGIILGKYRIKGDLYEINEDILERLDVVEGVPELFERATIRIKDHKDPVYVYIASDRLCKLLENNTTSWAIDTDKNNRTQEWIGHAS